MLLIESKTTQEFLTQELARRIQGNAYYSLRSFARSLGLNPGELSEVIRGKRALSLKSALTISKALKLSPAETEHWLKLLQNDKILRSKRKQPLNSLATEDKAKHTLLSVDFFRLVSDWLCFAILNLAESDDFNWDIAWIAKRFDVSAAHVLTSLDLLEKAELIERSGHEYTVVPDYVWSPDGVPSEAVKHYHRQILKKAAEAIDSQNVTERDLCGMGLAIDPKRLPEIQKEIRAFYKRITKKYETKKNAEVYQMETITFRLSNPTSRRKT